jgi:ribonucleotide reductase beta subunit family protein with ferritin-like domain
MNKQSMSDYIKFMANYLSINLGHPNLYYSNNLPIQNPFEFMENISISIRSNDFFKSETTDYSKAKSNNSIKENNLNFGDDLDY